MFPLAIIGLAVGIWLWSARQQEVVDASVATTIQDAAEAACNHAAMPVAISWPAPDLKLGFVSSISPRCDQAKQVPGGFDVQVTRGDLEDSDGHATHLALILIGGQPVIRLRLIVLDKDHLTIIGWSRP